MACVSAVVKRSPPIGDKIAVMNLLSRSFLLVCLGGLAAAAPSTTVAQTPTRRIEVLRLDDATSVLIPSERSSNTIVWNGSEGVVIVDNMADTMAAELDAALGIETVRRTRFVFNTHWHQNHTGGNGLFTGHASVLAPTKLRERLMEDQRLEFLVQQTFFKLPPAAWPNTTFDDSVTVHLNGAEVKAWHVRGHTDSDAIIYLTGPNVLALGDLYASRGWILPDLDTGGNVLGIAEALALALAVAPYDAIVVPGHGPMSTMAEVRAYHQGMAATIEFVREARGWGATLDQIQAMETSGATSRFLGTNPDRMLEAVYRSMNQEFTFSRR